MQNILNLLYDKNTKYILLLDFLMFGFLYLIPVLAHSLSIPFYLFEPMRIMVFSLILFTTKKNALLLAFSLPIVAHLMGEHPALIKAVLISVELCFNTILFYYLLQKNKNFFVNLMLSTVLSKVVYYSLKASLINSSILEGKLVSTPLLYQLISMILVSLLFGYLFRKLYNKSNQ